MRGGTRCRGKVVRGGGRGAGRVGRLTFGDHPVE